MTVAFLLYGTDLEGRDAFQEDKYRLLAEAFRDQGALVTTICYCNDHHDLVAPRLREVDFTLVWINPIEADLDRGRLDSLLSDLVREGHRLSAVPATILKLGTKDILFETKHLSWGSDVQRYTSREDFEVRFPTSIRSGPRVLKQHRGDGGKGVFKVEEREPGWYEVTSATDAVAHRLALGELIALLEPYFVNGHPLLDQRWNPDLANGVVRCYLTGARVVGFGYQEINMLYPKPLPASARRRHYYTENCGLFQDLRQELENNIVPRLLDQYKLKPDDLPILWDTDCFIQGGGRYSLCEVNASCVSPFPESAIPYVVEEVRRRAGAAHSDG